MGTQKRGRPGSELRARPLACTTQCPVLKLPCSSSQQVPVLRALTHLIIASSAPAASRSMPFSWLRASLLSSAHRHAQAQTHRHSHV